MEYLVQELLFPQKKYCTDDVLYYRSLYQGNYVENVGIKLYQGGGCSFDTYFNSFSSCKWFKYTKIKRIKLMLEFEGSLIVKIYSHKLINNIITEKKLEEAMIVNEQMKVAYIDITNPPKDGICDFRIFADSDVLLKKGGYVIEVNDAPRDITLALNMCTYQREEYIYKNIENIQKELNQNTNSPLYDKIRFYITDNAMSLDETKFTEDGITLTKQNAFGSVGGFTRGLIKILDDAKDKKITHTLFLDDDITIDPQVICRNYWFVSFIKDEYEDSWIGGAMLGLDFPTIQTESGGRIESGNYVCLKPNYDLSNLHAIVLNEIEENAQINAWWYCMMPIKGLSKDKLPYPVYFHCDDMEFALRNCKKLILLNGLCVWHMEFFYKRENFYFDKRNREILYSLHFPEEVNSKKAIKRLIRGVIHNIFSFRYSDARDVIDAHMDFLKGPEFLNSSVDRKKFNDIRKSYQEEIDIDKIDWPFKYDEYISSFNILGNPSRKRKILTLNGWLLKSNRSIIVSSANTVPAKFFGVKKALNYSVKTNKAFITEKDPKEALLITLEMIKTILAIMVKYKKASKDYYESLDLYTSEEHWINIYNNENV